MRLLGLLLIYSLGFFPVASAQQLFTPPLGAAITYDDFVGLAPEARREQFQRLSAEHKALFIRTHAQRWLAANQSRLSDAQIAAATDAIEFVTPQMYQQPNDPGVLERQRKITQKLSCTLGLENTRHAFVLDAPQQQSERSTWQSTADEWWSWLSECVVR